MIDYTLFNSDMDIIFLSDSFVKNKTKQNQKTFGPRVMNSNV